MDTMQIILTVIGGGFSVVAAPHLWRWLRARPGETRKNEQLAVQLQHQQTVQIIEQWQALAVASRQRADGLEARVAVLEAALAKEREEYTTRINELQQKLEAAEQARVAAERREAIANERSKDLEHRVGVLEAYVSTHTQLSVAAIQKGLMRALAQRAPAGDIDAIVADVVSNMGTGTDRG